MKTFLLLYCCFAVYSRVHTGPDDSFELQGRSSDSEVISGTKQRIVKTYHCVAENVKEQKIILYGTKAWTFPTQNVNLTLKYPSENSVEPDGYIVTGILVVLHIDGPRSRGYITEGGILQDHISMTFVIENISRLSYQFWMYGVSASSSCMSELTWYQNLCREPY